MAFELGFLVGSLLLLAVVVYVTRFRGPSLPHEAARSEGDPRARDASTAQTCDICGEERPCRSVGDLTVCADCDEELM